MRNPHVRPSQARSWRTERHSVNNPQRRTVQLPSCLDGPCVLLCMQVRSRLRPGASLWPLTKRQQMPRENRRLGFRPLLRDGSTEIESSFGAITCDESTLLLVYADRENYSLFWPTKANKYGIGELDSLLRSLGFDGSFVRSPKNRSTVSTRALLVTSNAEHLRGEANVAAVSQFDLSKNAEFELFSKAVSIEKDVIFVRYDVDFVSRSRPQFSVSLTVENPAYADGETGEVAVRLPKTTAPNMLFCNWLASRNGEISLRGINWPELSYAISYSLRRLADATQSEYTESSRSLKKSAGRSPLLRIEGFDGHG